MAGISSREDPHAAIDPFVVGLQSEFSSRRNGEHATQSICPGLILISTSMEKLWEIAQVVEVGAILQGFLHMHIEGTSICS